jgi:hypothetical protein
LPCSVALPNARHICEHDWGRRGRLKNSQPKWKSPGPSRGRRSWRDRLHMDYFETA